MAEDDRAEGGRRRPAGPPPPWWPDTEPWPPDGPPWARNLRQEWIRGARRARARAQWQAGAADWRDPRTGRLRSLNWHGAGEWPRGPFSRRFFLVRVAFGIALFATFLVLVTTIAIVLAAGLLGVVGLPVDARLGGVVVAVLVALLIIRGSRSVRRVAEPIGDLVEAAGSIEAGDLSARVTERGPREIRWLARAFNDMTARLEADEASRRTLLADITHELRTPLTVIQGNLEGLLDGVYPADPEHLAPILEETRTLSRLIDDLRTLALADRGALDLRREDVDLLLLANETIAALRATADAAGVTMAVQQANAQAPMVPQVSVDPTRIREVLGNLLSNAIQHTPPGGRIEVRLGVSALDDIVTVAVVDTGTGIPADVLPDVFERFVKTADSRGTGLGLAIARDLVEAHGGSIEASSPPTGGTTIRFSLPLARPPA